MVPALAGTKIKPSRDPLPVMVINKMLRKEVMQINRDVSAFDLYASVIPRRMVRISLRSGGEPKAKMREVMVLHHGERGGRVEERDRSRLGQSLVRLWRTQRGEPCPSYLVRGRKSSFSRLCWACNLFGMRHLGT